MNVVYVNKERETGRKGTKLGLVEGKFWNYLGRKAESENRGMENQGKRLQPETTQGDWAGDQGWDTVNKETDNTWILGLLAELRQGQAAWMKEPRGE